MENNSLQNFLIEKADYMACHRTCSETKMELYLIKENINFTTQYPIITPNGKGYIVDFFIPNKNIIIEVDGDYHNTPKQKIYDKLKDEELTKMGYSIIRINNMEVDFLDGHFYHKITGINPFKKKKKKKVNYRLAFKEKKKQRKILKL